MYENYVQSMMAAAQELAQKQPESAEAQNRICKSWGIDMDQMTDNEFKYFSSLVRDFM
jgi:hypothetical protein